VLTAFNVLNALAVAGGSLVGAWIFSDVAAGGSAFAALFVASAAGRLAALALLRGVPSVVSHHGEDVVLRTLAVRPTAGAVQRPILPTLSDEPEEEGISSTSGTRAPGEAARDAGPADDDRRAGTDR
jgi:hypothetical protein